MKKSISLLLIIWIWLAFAPSSFAQKPPKVPSKLGDALVLEFKPPFDRILIDTDEDKSVFDDRENIFVQVGTNTKILDAKGKPLAPEAIRSGMITDIKLERSLDLTNLIASQIKLKKNPENEVIEVKGFLDKVGDEAAFIDGKAVILVPNTILVGKDFEKNKTFSSFKDIPLGSIIDLKGTRREDGKIYVTQGQVKKNLFTPLEKQLI